MSTMAKTDEGSNDITDIKVSCSLDSIWVIHTREVKYVRMEMNVKEVGEVEKGKMGEGRRSGEGRRRGRGRKRKGRKVI